MDPVICLSSSAVALMFKNKKCNSFQFHLNMFTYSPPTARAFRLFLRVLFVFVGFCGESLPPAAVEELLRDAIPATSVHSSLQTCFLELSQYQWPN